MTTTALTSRQVIGCPACHSNESPDPLACTVCGGRGRVLSDPRQLALPIPETIIATR